MFAPQSRNVFCFVRALVARTMYFVLRLYGESEEGVNDFHFHPSESRSYHVAYPPVSSGRKPQRHKAANFPQKGILSFVIIRVFESLWFFLVLPRCFTQKFPAPEQQPDLIHPAILLCWIHMIQRHRDQRICLDVILLSESFD